MERFGQRLQYFAKNEVIMSAGTIGSAQILMLSGTYTWQILSLRNLKMLIFGDSVKMFRI